MRVLLINTNSIMPEIIDTPGGLAEWYRLINCDLIDITTHNIGGRSYDIIADDEGLLRGGRK